MPPKILDMVEKNRGAYGVSFTEVAGARCLHFDYGLTLRPITFPGLLDLHQRWQDMENMGVDHQVLSDWVDLFGYGMPAEEGARWHRLMNEHMSQAIAKHPRQLSYLASVPLQDAALAACELEYAVKQGGSVGGAIAPSVNDVNLGDAPLEEFWAAAVELDMPVFIHPSAPVLPPRARKYGMGPIALYPYDTTLSVGSLIFGGIMDRFPTLKLLLAHGGGNFPALIGRFDRMYRNQAGTPTSKQPPSSYLTRFYYDTLLLHPPALRYLCDTVGTDRVLLGTDYPMPMNDQDPVTGLASARLTADEVAKLAGGNAQRLFKLA